MQPERTTHEICHPHCVVLDPSAVYLPMQGLLPPLVDAFWWFWTQATTYALKVATLCTFQHTSNPCLCQTAGGWSSHLLVVIRAVFEAWGLQSLFQCVMEVVIRKKTLDDPQHERKNNLQTSTYNIKDDHLQKHGGHLSLLGQHSKNWAQLACSSRTQTSAN